MNQFLVENSRLVDVNLRVYPLALKKKKKPLLRPSDLAVRCSHNVSIPEFATEFIERSFNSRYSGKSRLNIAKHRRSASDKTASSYAKRDLHPPVCLDIPRLSYDDFKSRPAKSVAAEKVYCQNTFYISPRSQVTIFMQGQPHPPKDQKFHPIPMKKYPKVLKKQVTRARRRTSMDIDEKINRIFQLVKDPLI